MYSISSQIFEGLTEYIIASSEKSFNQTDYQEGSKKSGHLLADILKKSAMLEEKKFLHDFAFNLFEEALIKEGKVLELNADNIQEEIHKIEDVNFVKIRGRVGFNDTSIVESTLRNFNSLGYAIGYITQDDKFKNDLNNLENTVKNIKDRNKKAKATELLKNRDYLRKVLSEIGLLQDQTNLDQMAYIVNYGYNGQFEIQMPFSNDLEHYLFSGILRRAMLKESEQELLHKYSRTTEKEFVLFGVPTRTAKTVERLQMYRESTDDQGEKDGESGSNDKPKIKEGVMGIVSALTNLENLFIGKLDYEYVIDPIAVYREL